MPHRAQANSSKQWIDSLQAVPRIDELGPIAGRFVYSLRLIALHERAKRDPVPELAARLRNVAAATKSLALAQAISATWPENVHVSRFCCTLLTHDEATIGRMIDAAERGNHRSFEEQLSGLVRPQRIDALWQDCLALVAAEVQSN